MSKLFWIQRSAHCKTNLAQTNYDDFSSKQLAITAHIICTQYLNVASHCSNYKSTAFQHYIQLVKLFTSLLHNHFENKQHHFEQTLFFSENFSWPGGPAAPHFNWPKTKIYWRPGPVGPLLNQRTNGPVNAHLRPGICYLS